jgi:hypothetical protein
MYYLPKNSQNESLDYDNSQGSFKSYVSSGENAASAKLMRMTGRFRLPWGTQPEGQNFSRFVTF